ncbi:hypothetical protein [Methylobacterium marchantiae]|uniref:Uncharacterized protein n=1 Tax=Methylobacterium marchantiae TaxID=600331 RepID=A0ABW3WZA7_9HYPH|nr:hypothetical protein AIGOOFII_2687 [Methylobacterium marchantiae]
MHARLKTFHFLDVIKFARPSIVDIDPMLTAREIESRNTNSFLSYGAIYSRIKHIAENKIDQDYLDKNFSFYKKEWKNRCLKEVAGHLNDYFLARGSWYPSGPKLTPVLGTWFRPIKNGSWFVDGRSYDVLINPRKGQPLNEADMRFLVRAMYEIFGIDDPNNPDQLIIDISAPNPKGPRVLRSSNLSVETAISLNEFEGIMKLFFEALALAGISTQATRSDEMRDLFRRR